MARLYQIGLPASTQERLAQAVGQSKVPVDRPGFI